MKQNDKIIRVQYDVYVKFDKKDYDDKEQLDEDLDFIDFYLLQYLRKGEGDNVNAVDIESIELPNTDSENVRTALGQFIKWYVKTKGKFYDEGLLRLKSLLSVEKKQIVDAYNNGQTDGIFNKNVVDGAGHIYYDETFDLDVV